jgi:hypothetical protein
LIIGGIPAEIESGFHLKNMGVPLTKTRKTVDAFHRTPALLKAGFASPADNENPVTKSKPARRANCCIQMSS